MVLSEFHELGKILHILYSQIGHNLLNDHVLFIYLFPGPNYQIVPDPCQYLTNTHWINKEMNKEVWFKKIYQLYWGISDI